MNFKKNKGQSMVETALILPILLLIVFAIFEFGRIFNADLIITTASREGARRAVVGADDTEITDTVNSIMSTLDTASAVVKITPVKADRTSGVEVSVEVDYNVSIVAPVISSLIPNPFPISSKTTMMYE